jgi:peptidoglycan LD-endopeptidase CwlK
MLNSRYLSDLVPAVRARAEVVHAQLAAEGIDHVFASTLRDLESQAVLFRQGRPFSAIKAKADKLRARGFDYLAEVIMRVGPQHGPAIVTYAGPGESWHNYAEAFDCYPIVHGKLARDEDPVWQRYGAIVEAHGLVWAGRWPSFTEFPHAQLRAGSSPLNVLSPLEVRRALAAWL